jgi:hypothetical protein
MKQRGMKEMNRLPAYTIEARQCMRRKARIVKRMYCMVSPKKGKRSRE